MSDLKNNGTSQAAALFAANPGASKVFSIMLGTNDSSYGGSGGTPQTASRLQHGSDDAGNPIARRMADLQSRDSWSDLAQPERP